jgi:hypothetical protein
MYRFLKDSHPRRQEDSTLHSLPILTCISSPEMYIGNRELISMSIEIKRI